MKEFPVDNYGDIFDELAKLNIIPDDYATRIKGMAGFRNILVHEYADVDLDIIVDVLNNSLDDFREFANYIKNYIMVLYVICDFSFPALPCHIKHLPGLIL